MTTDSKIESCHAESSTKIDDQVSRETMALQKASLEELRSQIDAIDTQLLELLAKRQKVVHAVGDYKRARNLPPLDPKRWQSMLKVILSKAEKHGLCREFVQKIYDQIHEYSLELEGQKDVKKALFSANLSKDISVETSSHVLTLGIQGGKGSFNEEAAIHYCREQRLSPEIVHIEYLYTSPQVVQAVAEGRVMRGQCAIYNSAGGWVNETLEALKSAPVKVIEEFEIRIAHSIMMRPDQSFSQIDTLMCHPQVFAQCARTLAQKYPNLKQVSGTGDLIDNARIAEALANREIPDNVAVMGSKALADIYGLTVYEDNLQDMQDNLTRFLHVVRFN